jgi:hypothetical protein
MASSVRQLGDSFSMCAMPPNMNNVMRFTWIP